MRSGLFALAMAFVFPWHPAIHAQWGSRGEQRIPDRSQFPLWATASGYENDVFTFARIRYSSRYGGRGNRWSNDFPDSDWNRMVALLCHNNDLGDGWEREGENHEYFAKYSVPWSYPMGINIITYAMTH